MSKHVPRIYCGNALSVGVRQRLGEDVAHHLLNVLRLKPGAELVLFDGTGGEYLGVLLAAGKHWVEVDPCVHKDLNTESALRVLLAQAISRSDRMDYTIQKAVELGVQQIQPLATERSQGRLDASRQEKKHRHWQDVARAAAEQSGRACLPLVLPVQTLDAWLRNLPQEGQKLLLDPKASQNLKTIPAASGVCLLSGPEGGLSEAEIAEAMQTGFTAIRLGPRILRTETAAVACLSALQLLWGDLGG